MVTIVVLIILAVISINVVIGENGLIARAQIAKDYQANAEASDTETLQDASDKIETLTKKPGEVTTVKLKETTIPATWETTAGEKVKAIVSEDGETVPVPIGYTYSMIVGERSVNTGFVIKQGADGTKTSGVNEFVWVPVDEISDIYDADNNAGQLWDFGTTSSPKNPAEKITYPTTQNSGRREPDVVTGASSGSDSSSGSSHDNGTNSSTNVKRLDEAGFSTTDASNNLDGSADNAVTASDFKILLQNEFDAMIESVDTYGGFYIGRYETGNLSQSTAVVQKNNEDISNQTWYTMYKLSKTIAVNENVTSSMIWGSQWDATLRWMQNDGTTDAVKNFPTNSVGKGNYSGTQGLTNKAIPTGSNPAYAVNNIYDMAGNVYDWTLEAVGARIRTERGGNCNHAPSNNPASNRNHDDPTTSHALFGSRSTLYVALDAEETTE